MPNILKEVMPAEIIIYEPYELIDERQVIFSYYHPDI